jgi:hypothetical protein
LAVFSWWCSFGYPLGGFIAFNANVWLSSPEWCSHYLGTGPLMSFQRMTAFATIGFVIIAVMVVFIPEAKDNIELGLEISCEDTI